MTTIEKNRIICLFMGLRPKLESPDVYSFSDSPWFSTRGDDPGKVMDDIANYAKYHSDWNWLMECVSKIESLGFIFSIKEKSSAIKSKDTKEYVSIRLNGEDDSKIESVYNNCWNFIVCHNQQVNQNQKP